MQLQIHGQRSFWQLQSPGFKLEGTESLQSGPLRLWSEERLVESSFKSKDFTCFFFGFFSISPELSLTLQFHCFIVTPHDFMFILFVPLRVGLTVFSSLSVFLSFLALHQADRMLNPRTRLCVLASPQTPRTEVLQAHTRALHIHTRQLKPHPGLEKTASSLSHIPRYGWR